MAAQSTKTLRFEFLADTKKFLGNVGKVGKKFSDVGAQMKSTGDTINKVFAGIGVAAGATAAKSLTAFREFETGMNEVFTLLPGTSQETFDQINKDVLKLSKEIGKLPEDVIPALYDSLSAGVPPDNVFTFLETANKLAVGGATELGIAVDGLTTVVNAFGSDVISVGEASDIIFTAVKGGKTTVEQLSKAMFNVAPIAASMGIEFGNVTAAVATLTASGTPTSVAMTQIRAALSELAKPTTKISQLFREMTGQSFEEFIASGGDLKEGFDIIKKGAEQNGKPLADYVGSVEALGAIQTLTGKGADKFASELVNAANAVGATDAAFEQGSQGIGLVLEKLQASFKVLQIEIGQKLAPILIDAIENIQAKFKEIQPGLQAFVDNVKSFFASDQVVNTVNKLKDAFNTLQKNLAPVIDKIQAFFRANPKVAFTALAVVIGGILLASVVSLASAFAALFSPFTIVIGLIAAIAGGFRYAYDNFEGFRNFIDNGMTFLRDLFKRFIDFFQSDGFVGAMQRGLDFVKTQFNNLKDVFSGVVNFIKALFSGDVKGAVDSLKDIFKGLLSFFKNNWNLLGTLKDVFLNALTKAKDFIWPRLKEFGEGFIQTITTVLKTSAGVVLEGVKFVFNKVIDKINDFINGLNSGLAFSFFGIDIDPPDIPNIPRLAKGGIVTEPTVAMIGEAGTEAVIPLPSGVGDGKGLGNNINITVNAGIGTDGADVGRLIVEQIEKYNRRNLRIV